MKSPRKQSPISLHPFSPEDVLRAVMNTPLPPDKIASRKKTAAKKPVPRKKK